jgi:predicted HAD superfamily Cof-like phosphohydrolase
MREELKKVKEFHDSFGLKDKMLNSPSQIKQSDWELRHSLMEEENTEYLEACINDDLEEIADALGDQLYILCGTILAHGMGDIIVNIFNEIHRSNMSKLDDDGKPIYRKDGKIMKGKNYSKPNFKNILDITEK